MALHDSLAHVLIGSSKLPSTPQHAKTTLRDPEPTRGHLLDLIRFASLKLPSPQHPKLEIIPPASTQQSPLTLWPSPKPEGQHCRRRAVYVSFPSPSASGKFSGTLANGTFLSWSKCGSSHSSSGGSANSGALLVVRSRRRSLGSFSRNELQIYFPRTSTNLRKALREPHQRASAKQLAMRT